MIIDQPTDQLDTCQCGHKPTTYSIGYGPTPYNVHCSKCKKQTNYYRSVGGPPEAIIKFWNELAPLKELKEPTYQINKKKFKGIHAKREMRNYLLEECSLLTFEQTEVYRLFKNGKLRMDINFLKTEIYIKEVDY